MSEGSTTLNPSTTEVTSCPFTPGLNVSKSFIIGVVVVGVGPLRL